MPVAMAANFPVIVAMATSPKLKSLIKDSSREPLIAKSDQGVVMDSKKSMKKKNTVSKLKKMYFVDR